MEVRCGECIITGVCRLCSRLDHAASVLLQLFSSAADRTTEFSHHCTDPSDRVHRHIVTRPGPLTFGQLPLGGGGRLGLLAPGGGAAAADAADDGHGVVVASDLQRVPVGDERQPAVLALQGHLEGHEALQVHVAGGEPRRQRPAWLDSFPKGLLPKTTSHGSQYLHCLLVLSDQFAGELAEDVQKGQVEGRTALPLRTGILERKLDSIPKEIREGNNE